MTNEERAFAEACEDGLLWACEKCGDLWPANELTKDAKTCPDCKPCVRCANVNWIGIGHSCGRS